MSKTRRAFALFTISEQTPISCSFHRKNIIYLWIDFGRMSIDARLEAVPTVDIDEGVFKYILVKVYGKEKADGSEPAKLIVR